MVDERTLYPSMTGWPGKVLMVIHPGNSEVSIGQIVGRTVGHA
jgi:hypothetical protein